MRAIRIIPNQIMEIVHNYTRIIIKSEEYPELMNKDYLISPFEPQEKFSFSPGSLYFYHHFVIPDYSTLLELESLHGMDVDKLDEIMTQGYGSYPIHAYAFRFRPFHGDVAIEQDDGSEFIYDAKFQAHHNTGIEFIEDPMMYDPRRIDNHSLLHDFQVILAWVANNEDERAVRDGVDLDKIGHVVLREIIKRGLELDLHDTTTEMKGFVQKHLNEIQSKNLYHEYFSLDEVEYGVENRGGEKPYCVVHGSPQKAGSKTDKPKGSIIKCYKDKADADRHHKAIIISQAKRSGKFSRILLDDFMSDYESEIPQPYVSLVGSFMADGYSESYIDLHIDEESPNLRMELQVFQKLPKKLWPRINFIYGDVKTKIPLFGRNEFVTIETSEVDGHSHTITLPDKEEAEDFEEDDEKDKKYVDEKVVDPYLKHPTDKAEFSLNAVFNNNEMHLLLRKRFNGNCIATTINIGTSKMTDEKKDYEFKIGEHGFSNIQKQFFSEHWKQVKSLLGDNVNKFHTDLMGNVDGGNWGKEGYGEDGYSIELDRGEIEFLSLTPNFHEYQFHGKILNGRYVERKMEINRGDEGMEEKWFTYFSDSLPFVISQSAVNEDWITPHNVSGLPKHIEEKIPDGFRFWKASNTQLSLPMRDALMKQIDGIVSSKLQTNENLPISTYYTIQEDLDNDRWNINVVLNGRVYTFNCENNPIILKTNATFLRKHNPQAMAYSSDTMKILDKGECQVITIKENHFDVMLDGEIKGMFQFTRQKLSDVWDVRRDTYENITQIRFEDFMEITETKKTGDGYLKIKGILFRPGNFKGKNYNASVVKQATLNAIHRGNSLPYVNFFHNRDELSRIGIMTRIWWDANQKWKCGTTGKQYRGALMFEGIVTDTEGIKAIMEKGTYQVSAEVAFQDYQDNVQKMVITGVAICHSPAVDSAQIVRACYEGGHCIAFPVGITPATV